MLRFLAGTTLFFLLVPDAWLLAGERALIHAYRAVGSPVTRQVTTCRYTPSCSQHALDMLDRHGFWKGNAELGKRLLLCSPIGWTLEQFREEPYYPYPPK